MQYQRSEKALRGAGADGLLYKGLTAQHKPRADGQLVELLGHKLAAPIHAPTHSK
jgi:hypothetical protein